MEEELIKFYNLYKDDIFRFALSYTKNISDAEDVTQNVFIKLAKNINKLTNNNHIKNWCFCVCANECKNIKFSIWKKRIISLSKKYEIAQNIDDEYFDLYEELFRLKPKYRILIFLKYYEGYSVKEISKILKMKATTVQTNITRARKQIESGLKEKERC